MARANPIRRLVATLATTLFGTERYDAWVRASWWPRYLAVAALLAAVILLRRPEMVLHPQLWAEDGSIFLCDALFTGFPDAMLRLYRGFPHFVPRLIAAVGTLLPIAAAPRLYTAAAIALAALAVATFSLPRFRHLVGSDALRVAFCVACVSLPTNAEVLANPTNVGWLLALWLLLCSLSTPPRRPGSLTALTLGMLAAVASTPLAALFAPLWLLRIADATLRGDRRALAVPAALLLAVVALLAATPELGAEEPVVARPGTAPVVAEFHWGNLERATAYTTLTLVVPRLTLARFASERPLAFQASAAAILGLLLGAAALLGRRRLVPCLCLLALVVGAHALTLAGRPLFNLSLERPELWRYLPFRYAVLPIGCLLLCTVIVLDGIPGRGLRTGAAVATFALVAFAWWPTFRIPPMPDFHWSRWAARLEAKLAAGDREPLVIPMNPTGWRIRIDSPPEEAEGAAAPSADRCAGSTYHHAVTGWASPPAAVAPKIH